MMGAPAYPAYFLQERARKGAFDKKYAPFDKTLGPAGFYPCYPG